MVMLKDNHLDILGNTVSEAVNAVKNLCSFSQKIEVETRNEREALEAINSNVDIIMLDNFTPSEAKTVAAQLKSQKPEVQLEVSGGITPDNLEQYMDSNINIISMSCLIQGHPCVDFSLKVNRSGQ